MAKRRKNKKRKRNDKQFADSINQQTTTTEMMNPEKIKRVFLNLSFILGDECGLGELRYCCCCSPKRGDP